MPLPLDTSYDASGYDPNGLPSGLPIDQPRIDVYRGNASEDATAEPSIAQKISDTFLGTHGHERYQLWPERLVRSALSAPHDVYNSETPLTSQDLIAPALDMSALAGTGGLAGVGESAGAATLGAGPFLRPALKYEGKIYKAPMGGEHMDAVPPNLRNEFTKQAMSGEDISNFNFGFMNHKGQFLNREDALKYAIDQGLISEHNAKFGALTSTLMADSSKEGAAIGALEKSQSPFYSALEKNVADINQAKMTGDQWLGTLSNKPGVKPEEMDWTGLKDYLASKGKETVSKDEVQAHLNSNKVELGEVRKGASEYHQLQYKPTLENHLRNFEDILPAFKSVEDIALAKKHNIHFAETVKGYSDKEVFDTVQTAKKPLNFPENLFQKYDTRAEAETARKAAGAENHLDVNTERTNSDIKYHSYQLPGGENYKETLLMLPTEGYRAAKAKGISGSNLKEYEGTGTDNYKSSHWDDPNILAHVRTNERDVNGKPSLHVEEIQSDWHQQGREKGYKNPEEYQAKQNDYKKQLQDIQAERAKLVGSGNAIDKARYEELHNKESVITDQYNALHDQNAYGVPNAPFKKSWPELAMKRTIRQAVEEGKDRVSWTPGEAQAARYDLSKQVDAIDHIKNSNGTYDLIVKPKNGGQIEKLGLKENELSDIVGKEVAEKIIKGEGEKSPASKMKMLSGLDLKIGGEGMKGFYDQMLPNIVEKIGKKYGVKVKEGETSTADKGNGAFENIPTVNNSNPEKGTAKVKYFDIPEKMKQDVLKKSFALFSNPLPIPTQREK